MDVKVIIVISAILSLFLLGCKELQETERSKRLMHKQDKMLVENLISEEKSLETMIETAEVTESAYDI